MAVKPFFEWRTSFWGWQIFVGSHNVFAGEKNVRDQKMFLGKNIYGGQKLIFFEVKKV